jgi:hypothetical protein
MKKIGVIGPTDVTLIETKVGLAAGTLEGAAREIGAFLAAQALALICVPARGVGLWVLESYKKAEGQDSLALAPYAAGQPQEFRDRMRRQAATADRIRDDLTWGEEPTELARACDALVALGLSCGTLIEMAATKWLKGPPIFVVSAFISQIPVEVRAELDIRFCENLQRLKEALLEF